MGTNNRKETIPDALGAIVTEKIVQIREIKRKD